LAVLLPGASEREVLEVAERIRARLSTLSVSVSTATASKAVITGVPASFGAAVFPDVADTMDQLVLAADNALLCAKRDGRNRIVAARPDPPSVTDHSDQPVGD
jgi:diguanylate cyclase (GGDEF)-like protein